MSGAAAATPADPELQRLVAALPEVYQPIFGHPELSAGASRGCEHRWAVIQAVYDRLAADLGRPLRVLDLGCAQGWFSLQLARRGATVRGFDLNEANVAVCQALAARHPALAAEFARGAIEDVVPRLAGGDFDLALGLSVFHHLCAEHGQPFVRELLAQLLRQTPHALLELALAGEPPAWARALPENPEDLLEPIPFFRVISRHPTHLSDLPRPLYFCSRTHWLLDSLERFQLWSRGDGRRTYFGARALAKLYLDQPQHARALAQEAALLTAPSELRALPGLLEQGKAEGRAWLVTERPGGESVADHIRHDRPYDAAAILRQALAQLAAWERFDLFDPELRAAHVFADASGVAVVESATLIADRAQLRWPPQPFVAFWVFAHELLNRVELPLTPIEPRYYRHDGLPAPFAAWSVAFWAQPMEQWSFRQLLDAFPAVAAPPAPAPARRFEQWLTPLGYAVRYQAQPKYRGAASAEICLATKDGCDYFAVMDAGHFARLRAIQDTIPHMVPIAAQVNECFLFPRAAGRLLWDHEQPPEAAVLEAQLTAFAEATRRHGLIHGDLRPWNIFFDAERGVQVIDWGHGGFVDELTVGGFALNHIKETQHADWRVADLAGLDLEDTRRLIGLVKGEIGMQQAWGHERLPWLPPWCRP